MCIIVSLFLEGIVEDWYNPNRLASLNKDFIIIIIISSIIGVNLKYIDTQ